MNKTDFTSFKVGMLFNGVELSREPALVSARSVTIHYPSRLEAMALDPAKIAQNDNLVYTAGQIDFTVGIYKHVTVRVIDEKGVIQLTDRTPRKALARHAGLIMKQAIGFKEGVEIDVVEDLSLRHCGLGSSSGLIAAICSAINELFSKPISPEDLCRFCAQNHGEEIDGNDEELIPVQCLGGSAVSGNFDGSLVILAGEATPIMTINLPESLSVVIGVPTDFRHPDSSELMDKEAENMSGFVATGTAFGPQIAYRVVHEVMPGLARNDLRACKELIFDYRWDMGSIKNCSFVLPRINEIAENLRVYRDDPTVEIIALSSVGPGFFAITHDPEKIGRHFKELGMSVYYTAPHNGKYIMEDKSA